MADARGLDMNPNVLTVKTWKASVLLIREISMVSHLHNTESIEGLVAIDCNKITVDGCVLSPTIGASSSL